MGGFFSGSRSHFVNDNAPDRLTSIGFHANMFIEYDWAALKTFCNKRDISQTHLNLMFKKFLTYKNVHLNGYKVRLDDIKSFFLKETRITMELVGLLFPAVLLREYPALSPAVSHQEFTFARFVIGSYIFCALPMPDMISVLFSTIKQTAKAKRYLSIDTMIPMVTVDNVIKILSDDLDKSAALLYILHSLQKHQAKDGDEILLEDIIRLGLKYPLLFFELRRFQQQLRRVLHGDTFWNNRYFLKSRLEGISPQATWVPNSRQYEASFVSEYEAARVTAVTIVTDIFHTSHVWDMNVLNKEKPPKNTMIYSEKSKFHAMDHANAVIRSEKSWHQKRIGSLYEESGEEGDDGSTLPSLREGDEEGDELDSSPLPRNKNPNNHGNSHDLLDLAGYSATQYNPIHSERSNVIKYKSALEVGSPSPLKRGASSKGMAKVSPLRDGTSVEGRLSTTLITVEKKQYHAYDQDRWSPFKEGIIEGVNLGSPLKRRRDPQKYDFERRTVVVPFDPSNKYGASDKSFEREYDGSDTTSSVGGGSVGRGGILHLTSPGDIYLSAMGDGSPMFSSPSSPKQRTSTGNAFFGHLGLSESDLFSQESKEHTQETNSYLNKTKGEVVQFRAIESHVADMSVKLHIQQYPLLEVVDQLLCIRIKDLIGYRKARSLLLESQLMMQGDMPFLEEYDGTTELSYIENPEDEFTRENKKLFESHNVEDMPEYKDKENRRKGYLGELIGWATQDPPTHPYGHQGAPVASSSLVAKKSSQMPPQEQDEHSSVGAAHNGVISQSSSLSDSFVMDNNDSLSAGGGGTGDHAGNDGDGADNVVPFESIEDDADDEETPKNDNAVAKDKYGFVVDDDVAFDVARLKALASSQKSKSSFSTKDAMANDAAGGGGGDGGGVSQLVRRGSAMLGLSASLSSLSSSNKSLLTLSTKDKSDAFQNRDSARQSKARALSLATAGVNGTVFKAVWNNPLLTISQKEALFPTGNKEVLQQAADEKAIKQRRASTGNTILQKMGMDKPIGFVSGMVFGKTGSNGGVGGGPINGDASSVPSPSNSKVSAKSGVGVPTFQPQAKRGYAAALVWSSEWLTPEMKEYLYPRSVPNSAGIGAAFTKGVTGDLITKTGLSFEEKRMMKRK